MFVCLCVCMLCTIGLERAVLVFQEEGEYLPTCEGACFQVLCSLIFAPYECTFGVACCAVL